MVTTSWQSPHKEALDSLSSEAPDVILAEAECQGQEISGKDLCAIVETCPRLQHIPVILLTGSLCRPITLLPAIKSAPLFA